MRGSRWRRSALGFDFAAVTGVARHVRFAVGELGVDLAHQIEHHERRGFLRVVVAGPFALHVAVGAGLAEGLAGAGAGTGIAQGLQTGQPMAWAERDSIAWASSLIDAQAVRRAAKVTARRP